MSPLRGIANSPVIQELLVMVFSRISSPGRTRQGLTLPGALSRTRLSRFGAALPRLAGKAWTGIIPVLTCVLFQHTAYAAPPSIQTGNLGANQMTLQLISDTTGTGYFTLLAGSGATCGSATQTAAGQDSTSTIAVHGSLPLTAGTASNYTVRNLMPGTTYTVCFTPDGTTTPVSQDVATTAAPTFGPAAWTVVGTPDFSSGLIDDPSLAFSPDGTPYLAFRDSVNGSKAMVMEYNGSAWVPVGNADFSAGEAYNITFAFSPTGVPYVAYSDASVGDGATVMEYTGTAWATVGSVGFSPGSTNDLSLAFSPDGTPYVAFGDGSSGYKTTVMRYDGTSWVTVGSEGFSAGAVGWISLAFSPNGTPYVAYGDESNSYKTTAMRYDGSAWVAVGNTSFSADEADYVTLAFSPDGTPYVAYEDYGNSQKATVMQYNGTSWVAVGGPGFSPNEADYVTLAISPVGTPYVAYTDPTNSSVAVMQYSAGSWNSVASPDFPSYIGYVPSLAVSPGGIPYVAFQDPYNSYKATVIRLFNVPTATTGSASATTSSSVTLNGAANDNGTATTLSFEYGTSTSYGTTASATTPPGGAIAAGTGSTAASVDLTGLIPNTTYHFRLNATAGGITVNGSDATFTTDLATPIVTTWPTASPIVYGQTLASSTLTGGTASVPGIFSWTNSSIAPDAGTASQPVTFTPTDTTDYNTVSSTASVTVHMAVPTPSVSSATITYGAASTMLTASVVYGGAAPPTGAATFKVDSNAAVTAICTGSVSPLTCTASYPTGALTAGTHTITFVQAADANYAAASATAALAVTAPSDFTFVSSGTTNQTVTPGSTASFTFAIAPQGQLYPAAVAFTVAGLPPGATYTLAPSSIAQTGGPQAVALAVQTRSPMSKNHLPSTPFRNEAETALALALLPCCIHRRIRKRLRSHLTILLLAVSSLCIMTGLTGCGSGNGFLELQPQSYSISVTATSGSVQHAQTVVLNVQ